MKKVFFIYRENRDRDYFSRFFQAVSDCSLDIQFYEKDQPKFEHCLSVIIINKVEDLEELHSSITRRLYLAVSLESFSEKDKKVFYKKTSTFKYLKGVLDMDKDYEFNAPMLNTILQNESDEASVSKNELSKNLEQLLSQSLSDLQRLKKIHEKIVPVRQEVLKGLTITSKFGAGESSGGEFLDIVVGEKECLVLLSSSNSYVISSIVLTHFEYFRDKNHFSMNDIEKFLNELFLEIRDKELLDSSKRVLDIFVARIDLNFFKIEGFCFGDFEMTRSKNTFLLSNDLPLDEMFFEQSCFSSRLKRGEKVMVLSPGLKKILEESRFEKSLREVFLGYDKKTPKLFFNELFYQLKKDLPGDFLSHDATIIHIEVDKNVIVQI